MKIDIFGFASLVLLLAAGCVSPKAGPDAFSDYGPAMAHHDGYQMAYEWQRENPEAVKAATEPAVILGFVASDEAADALLKQIGSAYEGDPIVLTQIAAVTQRVMCRRDPNAPRLRRRWTAALERRIAAADDDYVKTFCRQQLRLCK